jgi:hypothetical protein
MFGEGVFQELSGFSRKLQDFAPILCHGRALYADERTTPYSRETDFTTSRLRPATDGPEPMI